MKKIFIFILLIFSTHLLFADGGMIHFQIEGIAYSHHRTILRNETIALRRTNQVFFFRTNQLGEYKVDIKIYTGCPSVQPPILDTIAYRKQIAESYGKTLQFFTKNSSVEIPNNWKNHTYINGKSKSGFIETQNLKFRNKKIPDDIEEEFCQLNDNLLMLKYYSVDDLGINNSPVESEMAALTLLNWKLQFLKLSQSEILRFLNLKKGSPLIFELNKERLVFKINNKRADSYNCKYTFIFENDKVVKVETKQKKDTI